MAFPLARLPPEILNQVISFKDTSHLILRLWKCGDTLLSSRLVKHATHLDLRHADHLPTQVPRMISLLGNLRFLLLQSKTSIMTQPHHWILVRETLPKTLETLRILCPDAESILLNYAPNPKASPITTVYKLGPSHYIDLSTLLPLLTDLEIGHDLDPCFLTALPSTLTRFAMPNFRINHQGYLALGYLPRSLVELHSQVKIKAFNSNISGLPTAKEIALQQGWISSFPPSLTFISDITLIDGFPTSWIPQRIHSKKFNVDCRTEKDPFLLQNLPPNSNQLELINFSPSHCRMETPNEGEKVDKNDSLTSEAFSTLGEYPWPELLPVNLVSLTVSPNMRETVPFGTNIKYLPRTLTNLSLDGASCDWSSLASAFRSLDTEGSVLCMDGFWPPSLTEMFFSVLTSYQEPFQLLPRTLRTLHIESLVFSKSEALIKVDQLPPSLTHFDFEVRQDQVQFTFTSPFPPSLTNLSFIQKLTQVGHVSGKVLASLPDSITSLHAQPDFLVVDYDVPWKLPVSLTHMDLDHWFCTMLSSLPKTLVSLLIKRIHGLDRLSKSGYEAVYRDLPTGLESVTILFAVDPPKNSKHLEFSPLSFSNLPRLQDLRISHGLFPSSIFKNLPRGLKGLSLSLPKLAQKHICFIPPQLELLELKLQKPIKWKTKGIVEQWPRLDVSFGASCGADPDIVTQIKRSSQNTMYQ